MDLVPSSATAFAKSGLEISEKDRSDLRGEAVKNGKLSRLAPDSIETTGSHNGSVAHDGNGVISIDLVNAWNGCLATLRHELDQQIFGAFIDPLVIGDFNCSDENGASGCLTILAPSKLVGDHVAKTYGKRLTQLLSERLSTNDAENFEITTKFVVDTSLAARAKAEAGRLITKPAVVVKKLKAPSSPDITSAVKPAQQPEPFGAKINPRYTFSNFVVGSSNQFCHAAARQVADGPGRSYNPLFIYGGVGLGKTHLLHAIGNAILANDPQRRVLYLSAETFMNELIQALRVGRMDEFKNRLRNIEVLLIDDIQFISGKERTQEEFFHTFNALYNSKHQIVITCDKIPQEIGGLEDRIKTRLAWGLIADLQAPDYETRVAILNRKASVDGCDLPQPVAHLIAEKISSNVRELEGALTRLHAVSSLQNMPINVELAENVLRPMLSPRTVSISVDDIKKAVAVHFNLKVPDLSSKRRTRNLSFPRHVAMYLCRKFTTCSYPEIGQLFGGRDHSSVIHAANVVARKVEDESDVRRIVEQLEVQLRG